MSEIKKTCGNCQQCIPASEEVYVCKAYNDDVTKREFKTAIVAKTCPYYTLANQGRRCFNVPVVWTVTGHVTIVLPENIEPTRENIIAYAESELANLPLPSDETYLEDSFEIDAEGIVRDVNGEEVCE